MDDETLPNEATDEVQRVDLQHLVGRYRIGELLGQGAVGQVHRALDIRTGRDVAVKFVRPRGAFSLRQVRRELTALRVLDLPGVVTLLDDGFAQGHYFLVMSLVEGTPFDEALGERDLSSGCRLVRHLLSTLARVHMAGVVHRDIKPGNVRVDTSGRPVFLDFGLAWGQPVARAGGHHVEGSRGYAAPEQWRGEPCDARTDLYAVGKMLETWACRPDVPDAIGQMVHTMTSVDPCDRPPSALAVLDVFGGSHEDITGRIQELPPQATQQDLRRLFGGPRVSFDHLDEDAAAYLLQQSGGTRAQVEQTLTSWVDQGLARWNGHHYDIDRADLDRLRRSAEPQGHLDLQQVMRQAEQARHEGRLGHAWSSLVPWTLLAREDPTQEIALLMRLVELSLEMEERATIDVALHHCQRSDLEDPTLQQCTRLLQGARSALIGEGERARQLLDEVDLSSPSLKRLCDGYRVLAASYQPIHEHEALVAALTRTHDTDGARASWLGNLAYRQGRWREAAAHHERATVARGLPHLTLIGHINAGQAWLEALDFHRAEGHASAALALAGKLRLPDIEARASWIERTASYRQRRFSAPRPELVHAALALGARRGALHAMTEAGMAWRMGSPLAAGLARQAAEAFQVTGVKAGVLLAQALEARCEDRVAERPADVIAQAREVGLAELCLQILALWPGIEVAATEVEALCTNRPVEEHDIVLDVLSISEARHILLGIDCQA